MNDFWTTVLSTAGAAACASAIVSGVITSVASIWLQHIYDKKLADHQAKVQKQIDDYQIRFRYWHEEKAKAIKELYEDACEWYFSLLQLHRFNILYKEIVLDDDLKREWNEMKRKGQTTKTKNANNWYRLRLFLNAEEDDAFNEFGKEANKWSKALNKKYEQKEEFAKGEEYNTTIKEILGNLRTIFRKALYATISETSLNDDNISKETNVPQTPLNDSSRRES